MFQQVMQKVTQWGLHDPKAAGLIVMGGVMLILILVLRREKRGISTFIKFLGPSRLAQMADEVRKEQLEAIEASRKKIRGLDAQLRQEQGGLGLFSADSRRFQKTIRHLGLTEVSDK